MVREVKKGVLHIQWLLVSQLLAVGVAKVIDSIIRLLFNKTIHPELPHDSVSFQLFS